MASTMIPVTLSLSGEQPTQATATLVERNPLERAGRALLTLLALWALAGLSVFIPIAHFALVPSFFLAGLIAAIVRAREDRSLVNVEGLCPRCKVVRHFGKAGRFREGKTIHCEGCGSQLEVRSRPRSNELAPPGEIVAAP